MKIINGINFFILSFFLNTSVYAEINNFFLGIGPNLVIGPSTISIPNACLGISNDNVQKTTLFNLSDDGRFRYSAFSGIRFLENFSAEFQYINLDAQHLIGINGKGLEEKSSGKFRSYYYGMDFSYFIPLHKKNELFLSIGGGNLNTNLNANFRSSSEPIAYNYGQNEAVLYLDGGVLIDIHKNVSVNVEISRLTAVTHGSDIPHLSLGINFHEGFSNSV